MPLYEYRCKNCDSTFERIVFAGDTDSISCPCCDGDQVEKLISCVSFLGGSSIGTCASNTPKGFS